MNSKYFVYELIPSAPRSIILSSFFGVILELITYSDVNIGIETKCK